MKKRVHPMAYEMRDRYRGDVKAGHSDAAEYWRGQVAALFTDNPEGPLERIVGESKWWKESLLKQENELRKMYIRGHIEGKYWIDTDGKKFARVGDNTEFEKLNKTFNPISFTSCLRCHYPVAIDRSGKGKCHNCGAKIVWRESNPFQATTGIITCHHRHKTRQSALRCLENRKIYGIGSSGKSKAFWRRYGVIEAISNPQTRARWQILKSTKKWSECGSCGAFHPSDFYGDCRDDDHRFWEDELPKNANIDYLEPNPKKRCPDCDGTETRPMTGSPSLYRGHRGNWYVCTNCGKQFTQTYRSQMRNPSLLAQEVGFHTKEGREGLERLSARGYRTPSGATLTTAFYSDTISKEERNWKYNTARALGHIRSTSKRLMDMSYPKIDMHGWGWRKWVNTKEVRFAPEGTKFPRYKES